MPQREDVRRTCLAMAAQRWKDIDALFGTVGYADIGMLRAPRETDMTHLARIVYLKTATSWAIA